MIKDIQQLEANYDGLPLEVMTIAPDTDVRAVMVIHHGMCEHKERYIWFMKQMSGQGIACVIADMRGHGASVRKEKDRGYFNGTDTKGVILDLHQVIYYAKELYPGLPVILFGHSMGSLVVRDYIKAHDFDLAGVILCGAPCKNFAAGMAHMMTSLLDHGPGKYHRSGLLYKAVLGSYDKAFRQERKTNGWLTVDQKVCDLYEADALCGIPFTIDGYRCLTGLLKEVYAKKGWDVTAPELPILLIAGSDDPVIGGVKGFRHTVHFLRGRGYYTVRGKLYVGYRHEILNDHCREQVVKDLGIWIRNMIL